MSPSFPSWTRRRRSLRYFSLHFLMSPAKHSQLCSKHSTIALQSCGRFIVEIYHTVDRLQSIMSPCHLVIMSKCHQVKMSSCHHIILSSSSSHQVIITTDTLTYIKGYRSASQKTKIIYVSNRYCVCCALHCTDKTHIPISAVLLHPVAIMPVGLRALLILAHTRLLIRALSLIFDTLYIIRQITKWLWLFGCVRTS